MSAGDFRSHSDLRSPHPWVWAVLYFPLGLAIGFPSVALGYLGARAGLGVSEIAAIVGMTFLASGWKFLWAPLGDYTLSRKSWYLIAVTLVAVGLISMTGIPISRRTAPLLSALTFLSTVAATFIASATEGLIAHNTTETTRGRAAGWFQSGNQFGQTAGGGIGLWLIQQRIFEKSCRFRNHGSCASRSQRGAAAIKCWRSRRNLCVWYSLRLKSSPSVLLSTGSKNHEESLLYEPALPTLGESLCRKHHPPRLLQDQMGEASSIAAAPARRMPARKSSRPP